MLRGWGEGGERVLRGWRESVERERVQGKVQKRVQRRVPRRVQRRVQTCRKFLTVSYTTDGTPTLVMYLGSAQ